MTARSKALVVLGITLAGLVAVLYAASRIIVGGSFTELETKQTRASVERALSFLSDDLNGLSATVNEAVRWSDLTSYAEPEDEGLLTRNLLQTLITEDIDLLAVIDSDGNLILGQAANLATREPAQFPKGLSELLSEDDLLLRHPDLGSSASGLVVIEEGPLLVGARALRARKGSEAIGGTFVMGRFVDSRKVAALADSAKLSLEAYQVSDPDMPPDFLKALSSSVGDSSIVVRPLDEENIAGYAVINDMYDRPALLLRSDIRRDIHSQGQTAMGYFLLSLLVVGVAFVVVTLLLLQKTILTRLTALSGRVRTIGSSGDLSARVSLPGSDELSDLAGEINRMLESLERSQDERKAAQEALAEQADRLTQSNQQLEQFAYSASHDMQEPLRKVMAFGDLLQTKRGEALDEQGRDYVRRMQDAAARMQALINDLLTFSRVTTKAQPFATVDLSDLTEGVLSDLEVAIEQSGGRVELGDMPTIEADPTQMRQLMQNLIGNGLKFHRPGEPPIVKVGVRPMNGQSGQLNGDSSPNNRCEIIVDDNGIGFDEAHRERIFSLFQRLHGRSAYEGTGIGLAICRRIAERHAGSIAAASTPGEGATFVVTLPVKQTGDSSVQEQAYSG